MATLDSQKAFDVVSHPILLDKLYHTGVNLKVWSLVKGMYKGLSSRVKLEGGYSDPFPISQGVRQGGILSTHLYKLYINDLLLDLQNSEFGKCIGCNYVGCPTCADDLSLMADCSIEFQAMLNIANQYSCDHRYTIHPEKSTALSKFKSLKSSVQPTEWMLGEAPLSIAEQTTHLGLIRAVKNEEKVNIENKITLARKTLYSLLNTGVHSTNGINPKVSYKIYQAYILPRLLSGLETLQLNQTQINELSLFHRKTLRQIQSLPQRTASSAVLLLLGALPLEAELHRRQLSLLYGIAKSNNETLHKLALRQSLVTDCNERSFFANIIHILDMYQLPSIQQLLESPPTKYQWKKLANQAVNSFWTIRLQQDLLQKSSLGLCNIQHLEIRRFHIVWSSVQPSTFDVKKAIVKARMLTGVYILQKQRSKFKKQESSSLIMSTVPPRRGGSFAYDYEMSNFS